MKSGRLENGKGNFRSQAQYDACVAAMAALGRRQTGGQGVLDVPYFDQIPCDDGMGRRDYGSYQTNAARRTLHFHYSRYIEAFEDEAFVAQL